jgi:FKBP12-rapamycin complex-associated protein
MTREHYPERIPFRLTRMLIAAMEVSGIEGNYRSTCDSVMKVLREVGEGPPSALPVLVLVVAASFRCLTATRVPVLGVLRLQHRDSVMAMLEAFVHDPLINWRLLKPSEASGTIL